MSAIIPPSESFRDTISTVEDDGSRKWIFAKKPKGYFYSLRSVLSWVYLIVFFGLPWITYEKEPIFMLNVIERKFIIFGLHFGVQDLIVFGIAMLTFVVFVVLFTVIFGRLFCGWACPQTIFMEMLFRKIEYWIDGDAAQQRILSKSAWTSKKIFKRILKYKIFFLLSFLIANTFLAYIIGSPSLVKIIQEPLSQHIVGLMALIIFTIAFFVVYSFMREQICIVACPYGRLQGVMLDKNSIVVAYDYVRGEPRGKVKKEKKCSGGCDSCTSMHEPQLQGDCIDCKACIHVCPTGIDIRNGTQLECINCTACIDACDDIMLKINKPKGLIRYASENNIKDGTKLNFFSKRILAYSFVLIALLALLAFTFLSHTSIDVSVLRTPGQFYQEHEDGTISNLYNYKITNKKNKALKLRFVLEDSKGTIQLVGDSTIHIEPSGNKQGQMFIIFNQKHLKEKKSSLAIQVEDENKTITTLKTTFMSPINNE
ncbi:MAG: cytochrome c oxidase accessory protein CcoG [Chitinophagaceae bacterium]